MTYLDCDRNSLVSLNLTQNSKLETLLCFENKLTSLDLSGNPELNSLNCHSNQLPDLNLSRNPKLKGLYCEVNELTSLDLSRNTELEQFSCYRNHLTSLDLDSQSKLWNWHLGGQSAELQATFDSVNERYLFDLSSFTGVEANRIIRIVGPLNDGLSDYDGSYSEGVVSVGLSGYQPLNHFVYEYDVNLNSQAPNTYGDESMYVTVNLSYPDIFSVRYLNEQDQELEKQMIESGHDARPPEVPGKAGYTGEWDHDGKNITEDTTIRPSYTKTTTPTPAPSDPQTSTTTTAPSDPQTSTATTAPSESQGTGPAAGDPTLPAHPDYQGGPEVESQHSSPSKLLDLSGMPREMSAPDLPPVPVKSSILPATGAISTEVFSLLSLVAGSALGGLGLYKRKRN